MKKNRRIRLLSLVLAMLCLATLVSGCGTYDLDLPVAQKQHVQNVEDGWISGVRTGILRQGISGQFKSYECTDERVYFMVNVDGRNMLYSMKHDESVLVPLCPSDGCSHADLSCSAYYGTNGNVCFYDDALFVSSGTKLYRMNPDGTDRMVLYDIEHDEDLMDEGYTAITDPKLWNGMFTFNMVSTRWDDEALMMMLWTDLHLQIGTEVPYFFKLDGSMGKAQEMGWVSGEIGGTPIAMYNDGNNFIVRSQGQGEEKQGYYLSTWNPWNGTFDWFADVTPIWLEEYTPAMPDGGTPIRAWGKFAEAYGEGYWGKDYAIYLRTTEEDRRATNSAVCKLDYASGKTQVLMELGMEGNWRLCCFPDCFVLIQTMNNTKRLPDPPRMLIYNWDMQPLADDLIELDLNILPQDLICGETENRIYLAAGFNGVPEYYIEKTELTGGDISLHPLTSENLDLAAYHDYWTQIIEDRAIAIQEQNQIAIEGEQELYDTLYGDG